VSGLSDLLLSPPSPPHNNYAAPCSVNWTAAGVFGPVHDVGKCLCAWAVTVADTITALEAITSGSPPVPLSIQQLVDCTLKFVCVTTPCSTQGSSLLGCALLSQMGVDWMCRRVAPSWYAMCVAVASGASFSLVSTHARCVVSAYTYVTSEGLCNATEYPFHASNGPYVVAFNQPRGLCWVYACGVVWLR